MESKNYTEMGLKKMTVERLQKTAREAGVSELIIGIQSKAQLVETVMKALKGEGIKVEREKKENVIKRVIGKNNPEHELLKDDEEREWVQLNYIPGNEVPEDWSEAMRDEADAINALEILIEGKEMDETKLLSVEMQEILADLRKTGVEVIGTTEEKVMQEQPVVEKKKKEVSSITKEPKEKKQKGTFEYKRLEAAKDLKVPEGAELTKRGELKIGDVFTNVGSMVWKKVISFQEFPDGLILFTYCMRNDETKVETKRLAPYMPVFRLMAA